jgi:hypothetical protein
MKRQPRKRDATREEIKTADETRLVVLLAVVVLCVLGARVLSTSNRSDWFRIGLLCNPSSLLPEVTA